MNKYQPINKDDKVKMLRSLVESALDRADRARREVIEAEGCARGLEQEANDLEKTGFYCELCMVWHGTSWAGCLKKGR